MGACGLIAMAAVLYLMRYRNRAHWKERENENLIGKDIEVQGPIEVGALRRYFSLAGLNSMDYQIMAQRFKMKNALPDEFMYSDYLNLTLATNACNLMDVHWTCWLLLLVIASCFYLLRLFRKSTMGATNYVVTFELLNWSILAAFVLMFCWVNSAHSFLMRVLRQDEKALQEKGVKMGDDLEKNGKDFEKHPMTHAWAERVKFWMQFTALVNSFLCSFYIMHFQYNLKTAGFSPIWLPITIFPLLAGLFLMLPLIITKFTIVESFFSPDGNALDEAIQMLHQLDDDIEYIRRMWVAKGEPNIPALEEGTGVDETEFGTLLRDLEIHISDVRCHRVFKAMDADKSCTVSAEEFSTKMNQILQAPFSPNETASLFVFKKFTEGSSKSPSEASPSKDSC
jgi:hypothetical protein